MTRVNTHNRSEDLGFPLYMTFCAVIAALSGFNVGWHINVPNMPAQVISKCTDGTIPVGALPACLPMSDFTWGYTVGAFALGGMAGSLATVYLNQWFGRRDNIMISCGWFIFGGILSACAINIGMYSVGRAFVGIGSGMCGSSVAIYVSEISTKTSRGALGSLFELFLNLGLLLTQVAGLYMSYAPAWRLLWAIPTIISALQLAVLFFFTVECPRRLTSKGQNDKAREALQKLRGTADITNEFDNLLAARQFEIERGNRKWSMLDVFLFKDWKITWNTFIVMVLQAYNQVGGIGPMSVYSLSLLTAALGDASLATDVALADAAGNVVATIIAVLFMHRVGRKGFMIISLTGMTIGSVFMVIGSNVNGGIVGLVVAAAIIFTFTYSMGCGVIPWLIAPELLPLHALPAGSALGNTSNWLFNFIINTVWPQMDANLGKFSFIVFAAINFVGLVFVVFAMRETTGKDLDQTNDDKKVSNDVESSDGGSDRKDDDHIHHIENSH
ncbi:general substrate transporter [Syncephalastrum racemosum]|uniref:General substrate transporter n=1 Tax=Syncephalastrum racemosum TaxID=13706 RepID=A0A1X2H1A3_SYNRA|nr:general substrate transporter [Syncephalastrum racemosum]